MMKKQFIVSWVCSVEKLWDVCIRNCLKGVSELIFGSPLFFDDLKRHD